MSKRFPPQDHFRYSKLGKKWRRPVGTQSKLRIARGGSGMKVAVGYGTARAMRNRIGGLEFTLVFTPNDLEKTDKKAILIASGVGALKTKLIAEKAKSLGMIVINRNKLKKTKRIEREIQTNKNVPKDKKKPHAEKKEEKKETAEGK